MFKYTPPRLSESEAMRVGFEVEPKLTGTQAQEALHLLNSEKWLYLSADRGEKTNVELGPRTLVELRGWIDAEHPGALGDCGACERIVVDFIRCGNGTKKRADLPSGDDCNAKFHLGCAERFLKVQNKCMACRQPWKTDFV